MNNKDYCPNRFDILPGGVVQYNESYYDNCVSEMKGEMNIDIYDNNNTLKRIFQFPYHDEHVKVWGELYELYYNGTMNDIIRQKEEVDSIQRLSLYELKIMIDDKKIK